MEKTRTGKEKKRMINRDKRFHLLAVLKKQIATKEDQYESHMCDV